MAKFKKKYEEVEAFKWILGSPNTPKWFYQAFEKGTIWLDESLNSMNRKGEVKKTICIKYKNGVIRATNGDWIIKDSEGKIYSCTCGDFEKYYEDLDDEKSEHTAIGENSTIYAENVEERHRQRNKLSTEMTLDSTNFQENIKNAAKELNLFIDILEKADDKIDKLTEKMNKCACKVDIDKIVKQLSESLRESIE